MCSFSQNPNRIFFGFSHRRKLVRYFPRMSGVFPQTSPPTMVTAVAFMATIMVIIPQISHAQSLITHTCAHPMLDCWPSPPKPSPRFQTNQSVNLPYGKMDAVDAAELRCQFLQVLRSRRSAEVPLSVEPAKPVAEPLYQEDTRPTISLAMETCPRANITNLKDLLHEENFYLITEEAEQGRVPVLILSLKQDNPGKRPAVVFLHSTKKNKEWLRPLLEAYASRGYIAVAIDARYHGERAKNLTTYEDALVSSWKKGDTMPFIFDTAWDLIKLADYLTQREDIDHDRIGITGESLGGMHAWFAAFTDTRYSVVVPVIGVQSFQWAIDNDKWQARVDHMKPVFEKAQTDLHKSAIDKEVVEKVWDRIAPGLASKFDSPYTVPIISPRPLLIVNGAEDPRCPLAGLDTPVSRASKAYKEANVPDNFKMIAEPGIRHQITPLMVKEASDWFDRFFKM